MSNENNIKHVIVVGAGPSGALLAIMLARQNIQITVLDGGAGPDTNPRAAHYAPSAVYDFARAGVLEDVSAQGFSPNAVCWRYPDSSIIAKIPRAEKVDYPMVVLPLDRLLKVFDKHLESLPNVGVHWNHKVVNVEHGDGVAKIKAETSEGEKWFEADYVVGADGANSGVRKCLFGREYPGETLPQQIIASNVYYDFKKFGHLDSNFIVHPTNWYMSARITNDGLWRCTYGDIPDLTKEEYLERAPMRYEEILPGSPKPGDYKIVGLSPYKLQQRCSPSFRKGRFLLVADAAHLCNPFGGLGLTGGFADVGSLYDCLMGIHWGVAKEDILDKYSEIRIKIWREMIDPISRENFRRLWDESEEADRSREDFWKLCRQCEEDETFLINFHQGIHAVRHDFTQYYDKPVTANGAPTAEIRA